MLAALASAAMPSIVMAGVRDSERANDTDDAAGIDQAVLQDAAGRMYDIYACDTEDGRKRLTGRVQAARTLERAKDPGGLGFALDTVLAFVDGKEKSTLTGGATVMVAAHNDGVARPLDLLTLDDCAAMGTAIGAIHRLRPNFLQAESYPVFSTGQIRAQLTAWIKRLHRDGGPVVVRHLPGAWRVLGWRRAVFRRDHHRGDELAKHAGQRSGTRSRVDFRQA